MPTISFTNLLRRALLLTAIPALFHTALPQDARAQVNIMLPEITASLEETVTIEVEVGNLTDQNVFGFEFTINYDPSVLEILSLEREGTVSDSFSAVEGKDTPETGTYKIAGASASPVSGSGTFIKINAKSKAEGSSPLTWAKSDLNTYNATTGVEGKLQVQTTDGQVTVSKSTSSEPGMELPSALKLHQNMPNPFNPSTRIDFEIPASGRVQVTLFDLLGRQINTLVDSSLPAGTHSIDFDASGLPSGIYLYTLTTGVGSLTRTMHLAK